MNNEREYFTEVYCDYSWEFIPMLALWLKEFKYDFGLNGEDKAHTMELYLPFFILRWHIQYIQKDSFYSRNANPI